MKEIELIKELSDAFGPSGLEDDVCKIVKRELMDFYNMEEDTLRNVRCSLSPETNKVSVMLDSHMDEVGLIVQAVKPNGTMNFLPIGGWAATSFPSSKFLLKNREGNLVESVVAMKPVHFMSEAERNASLQVSNMVLDCGALSSQEVEDYFKLGIASFGVPSVKCTYNEDTKLFFGKAFDCRIGVAAEIETMKRLKNSKLNVGVTASFSSQEEVGHRAILQNVEALKPSIAICFEGAPADDIYEESYKVQAALNKGPMLRHFDSTMITNPRFQRFALDIAKKYQIPVQEAVRSGGGTNGADIHKRDIPTIVIAIPVRYIHSSHSYCSLKDYEAAVELAVKICEDIDESIIKSF